MSQVIKGTDDAKVALAKFAAGAPACPKPFGPQSLAGPVALVPPTALPGSDPSARHALASAAAAVPSVLRLPAVIEAGGRRVRVELGAVEGWKNSSSLIALPHGMEAHRCIAVLTQHQASPDASRLATADSPGVGPGSGGSAGGPTTDDAGRPRPAATAIMFLFMRSSKVIRFRAQL